MKNTKKFVMWLTVFTLLVGVGLFFQPNNVRAGGNADGICDDGESGPDDCNGVCGIDNSGNSETEGVCTADCDPLGRCPTEKLQLGKEADPRVTVMRIINVALGFLGTIAVVIILYGGFKWMTSQGSEDKVSEARKLMFMGIVGLAIVLAAYSITTFVIQGLLEATQ